MLPMPDARRANHQKPVQSSPEKYFAFPVGQISATSSRHPVPMRGAFRDRHERGMGCGGRSGARDERANAYGEAVWS